MTRRAIFLTREWPAPAVEALEADYAVTRNRTDAPLDDAALKTGLADHDAFCPTVSDRIAAEIVAAPSRRAQIIASYGVGFNHIDIDACRAAGIIVTNTPDVLTGATADLAMMLLLMSGRRAGEGERELRAGKWQGWRPTHMMGSELSGKTLGLVGFGRIAQAVAERARFGFGMSIAYWSRIRAPTEVEAHLDARHCGELTELLGLSDYVSLHVPGGSTTRHLIDASTLATMRRGAHLINTARGDIVDETALLDSLRSGHVAGAGLDVYPDEPRVNPGFLALDNVVLLPHLGSATLETRTAMGMRVKRNLDAFFAGTQPPDRVA